MLTRVKLLGHIIESKKIKTLNITDRRISKAGTNKQYEITPWLPRNHKFTSQVPIWNAINTSTSLQITTQRKGI